MFAKLIFALAMVANGDPVAGYPYHMPAIGERAVLHYYDVDLGTVEPDIEVWSKIIALSKFAEGMQSEVYKRERAKALGNPKELDAVIERQRDLLLKEPTERREVGRLPDMTPVRVLVLARVFKPDISDMFPHVLTPDFILVEALDGPAKGLFFWAPKFAVRVPGAKAPTLDDLKLDIDPKMKQPGVKPNSVPDPVRRASTTQLLVESSSWDRPLDGFVQVHCRVQNTSGKALKFVIATVVFEDAAGNLVHSAKMIVGDLQPGESKTVASFDKHDARMDHYKFEFEGQDDSGKDRVLDFSTAGKKGAAGSR
jgi:hypothetical protein